MNQWRFLAPAAGCTEVQGFISSVRPVTGEREIMERMYPARGKVIVPGGSNQNVTGPVHVPFTAVRQRGGQ